MRLVRFLNQSTANAEYVNSAQNVNTFRNTTATSDTRCYSPQTTASVNQSDFVITTGIILDTLPYNYLYRVSTQLVGMPIVCSAMQTTAVGRFSSAGCSAYTAGTAVVVAYSYARRTGIILGAFDIPQGLEDYNIKTNVAAVIRTHDEVTDKGILINSQKDKNNGSFNASQLKFEEHVDTPEWGMSFVSGMRIFVNPYMAFFGTNDYTGMQLFECDDLLRISGINMQQRTTGRENEWLNDAGEYIEYCGSSLYPWEHFGSYKKPDSPIMVRKKPEEWHTEGSVVNFYEPVKENLRPFHRVMEYGGWLGQGESLQVIAPPAGKDFAFFGVKDKTNCVARVHTDVTGNINIRSAKSISITKHGIMPAAVRLQRPDEIHANTGDNPNNYSNEGLALPKDFKTNASDAAMQCALGILDYSGYNKNWGDIFQFAYHTDDYYVPEESDLIYPSLSKPKYDELKTKYMISEHSDDMYYVDIDDNRKNVEYTGHEAGIHLLSDGGIVIYDGAGSEIRFVKGQLTISCAGDINIKPGRMLNLWAGGDIITRTNGNFEVSSSDGDVRIKAENNLELLGANSGSAEHGVIIESKSTLGDFDFSKLGNEIKTNGIILKADNAPIANIGRYVYLRSGTDPERAGEGIYLDASNGNAPLYVNSYNVIEYLTREHVINFAAKDTREVQKSTEFRSNRTLLNGETVITKKVYINGDLDVDGNITSCEMIKSFSNGDGLIKVISEPERDTTVDAIDRVVDFPEKKVPQSMDNTYKSTLSTIYYADNRIGNEDVLPGISFSFRTDDQLKLPQGFAVYEDLWQHIADASGSSTTKWKEKAVEANSGTTYPFPGEKCYTTSCYTTQDTVIADFNNQCYIDRNVNSHASMPGETKYANPEYGHQKKYPLNDYKII